MLHYSILLHSSTITFDTQSWISKKSFVFNDYFLHVNFLKILFTLIWLLRFRLIASKIWKIIIIVIFAFDKFELIETFAEIVAIMSSNWRLFSRQNDDCFSFFFNSFQIKSFEQIVRITKQCCKNETIEISMILWSEISCEFIILYIFEIENFWHISRYRSLFV